MAYSAMSFMFLQLVIFIGIIFLLFHLINKWITNHFAHKQEENEIKQEQNEILRDLVKTVGISLDKRNSTS